MNLIHLYFSGEKSSGSAGDDKNLQQTLKETQNGTTVMMIQKPKKPVKLQHSKIVTYVDAPLAPNRNCTLKINLKWKKPLCAKKEGTQDPSNANKDSELLSCYSVDLQNQPSPDFMKKEDFGRSTHCSSEGRRSTGKLKVGQVW